jgi:hypothetical protein
MNPFGKIGPCPRSARLALRVALWVNGRPPRKCQGNQGLWADDRFANKSVVGAQKGLILRLLRQRVDRLFVEAEERIIDGCWPCSVEWVFR